MTSTSTETMKIKISLFVCALIVLVPAALAQKPASPPWNMYTSPNARNEQITGTVVLKCVFTADGEVTNIRVIQGLPKGLTEKSIEAARKIKFIPATKNGRNISMWMQLEYNFNLYP